MLSFDITKLREFIDEENMFMRKNIFLSDALQVRALFLRPTQHISSEYLEHDAALYVAEGIVSVTYGDGEGKTVGAGFVVILQRGESYRVANTGEKKASLLEVVGQPRPEHEKIGVQMAEGGDFRETLYPVE